MWVYINTYIYIIWTVDTLVYMYTSLEMPSWVISTNMFSYLILPVSTYAWNFSIIKIIISIHCLRKQQKDKLDTAFSCISYSFRHSYLGISFRVTHIKLESLLSRSNFSPLSTGSREFEDAMAAALLHQAESAQVCLTVCPRRRCSRGSGRIYFIFCCLCGGGGGTRNAFQLPLVGGSLGGGTPGFRSPSLSLPSLWAHRNPL